MLIVAFLQNVRDSVRAYLTVCFRTTFDVVRGAAVEQASFLKFYSIQLFLTAFAVYVFYRACDQFGSDDVHPACYAPAMNAVQVLALAEIGLFILYVLAFVEASVLLRAAPRLYVLPSTEDGRAGGRSALTRAIYQPAVKWFPLVLIVACLVEWSPLREFAQRCMRDGVPLPRFGWMGALLPGLALAFLAAVGIELMFRHRRPARGIWLPIAMMFAAYVATAALIGPADVARIVFGVRALPGLISGVIERLMA